MVILEPDSFKQRQLAALKRDIAIGIKQLNDERFRTYDASNVMLLAENIGQAGRKRIANSHLFD